MRGQSPLWWDWDGPGLTPHTLALVDALARAAATWPLAPALVVVDRPGRGCAAGRGQPARHVRDARPTKTVVEASRFDPAADGTVAHPASDKAA